MTYTIIKDEVVAKMRQNGYTKSDILVFSRIATFENGFNGSYKYLSSKLGISLKQVYISCNKLTKNNLLLKKVEFDKNRVGYRYCIYNVNEKELEKLISEEKEYYKQEELKEEKEEKEEITDNQVLEKIEKNNNEDNKYLSVDEIIEGNIKDYKEIDKQQIDIQELIHKIAKQKQPFKNYTISYYQQPTKNEDVKKIQQVENDNFNQVPYKYISNKDNNIQNQNDIFITYEYCKKLYNDMKFTFDLKEFWLFYKEKAIFKKDCNLKMYQWQKRLDEKKEKELKEQKEQEIKQEQDLKTNDIKFEYDMATNTYIKYRLIVKDGKVFKQIIKE